MKRNHSKFQAITFGRVERNPVLTCEGTVTPSQDEMELPDVTIDNKLKFEGQIRKISRKVSQQRFKFTATVYSAEDVRMGYPDTNKLRLSLTHLPELRHT